jgi:hemolysin activation/secretion protein
MGADANFSKLDGTLGYSQTLAEHLTLSLTARGQTSFGQTLERAEQIGIAGPGSLSAFDTGSLQGDSGVVARGELGAPFVLPKLIDTVGFIATPYAFLAAGEVDLAHPTAVQTSIVRADSFGLGLRLAGGRVGRLSNGTFVMEYGRETRSDGLPDGDRLTVVFNAKF